jgi:hypothetical protein
MDVTQAQQLVERKRQEDAELERAQAIAWAEKNRQRARNGIEAKIRRCEQQLAEGERTLAGLKKALAALGGLSEEALARWGSGEYSDGSDDGRGFIALPSVTAVPGTLRRSISVATERLAQLREDLVRLRGEESS